MSFAIKTFFDTLDPNSSTGNFTGLWHDYYIPIYQPPYKETISRTVTNLILNPTLEEEGVSRVESEEGLEILVELAGFSSEDIEVMVNPSKKGISIKGKNEDLDRDVDKFVRLDFSKYSSDIVGEIKDGLLRLKVKVLDTLLPKQIKLS